MADQPLPREAEPDHGPADDDGRWCVCGNFYPHVVTPTPPIEPEAEPLTADCPVCSARFTDPTIDRLTRERDEALEQATVWNAAWAELARKQIGPIA